MSIIDDDGNLFGAVNVIDALAVVLFLAVLVAGIAFVGVIGPDGEPETRYATIELGEQPEYVVDRVSEGDVVSPEGTSDTITVTDVYVTPGEADGAVEPSVIVRGEVNGQLIETDDDQVFEYAGERLRVDTELEMDTDEYFAEGVVTSVEDEDPTLGIEQTPVLLEATVSGTTADEMTDDDSIQLGPHTTAEMTNVQLYPLGDGQYRALVGAELTTLQRGSSVTYGGESVAVGNTLQMQFDAYDIDAEVVRRGTDTEIGEPTTTTAEIELENVRRSVADGLEAGMEERIRGETLATVRSVDSQPAEVVLESDDGDIHLREHPQNKDVTLIVDLQTRATDTGLRFHGESFTEDESVILDFDLKTVEGEVTRIR